MKRLIATILLCLLLTSTLLGSDVTTFTRVKLADPKGTQTKARLLLDDANKKIVIQVADHDFATIPYADLDKASYQYSKRFRLTEGSLIALGFWPVGGIVMLTKSKSHWLYLEYHQGAVPKNIVLRMHKDEYKQILEAIKSHTGKEVVVVEEDKSKGRAKEQKTTN